VLGEQLWKIRNDKCNPKAIEITWKYSEESEALLFAAFGCDHIQVYLKHIVETTLQSKLQR